MATKRDQVHALVERFRHPLGLADHECGSD
jgi:hypothetical protein